MFKYQMLIAQCAADEIKNVICTPRVVLIGSISAGAFSALLKFYVAIYALPLTYFKIDSTDKG